VRPERFLVPLAAIAIAVFATSRLMVAIDPGEAHPTGLTGAYSDTADGKPAKAKHREHGAGKHRSRETHSFYSAKGVRDLQRLIRQAAGPESRISLFRLQSDAAQVFTRAAGGSGGKMLVIERGPRVKFSASTAVATPGGFTLGALDPKAPARILAAIARLSHAPPSGVDYMVFSTNPIDREGRWDAFLTGGATHFAADAHGRRVTQP
jgi:hypothetical protein